MYVSRPSSVRIGASSVIIIATPEKIAPTTKYGAKIVLCQPGRSVVAKSHETTLCTDTASGTARAASRPYRLL